MSSIPGRRVINLLAPLTALVAPWEVSYGDHEETVNGQFLQRGRKIM